jgi:predicted porin
MKKVFNYTAIAAACMVAPVAFAEVTISGTLDQAYEKVTTANNSGRSSVSRLEPTLSNYGELKFKGSEDLGSGMKANFELSVKNVGPSDAEDTVDNYTSFVGLSGNFGNIKVGSQWRPFFTAIAGIDPAQLAKVPGFVGTSSLGGLSGLGTNPNRNSITYNLPSLTPGLFIQFQKGFSETSTGQGDSKGMYAIFTDGAKFFAAYSTHEESMAASGKYGAALTGSFAQSGLTEVAQTWGNTNSNGLNHVLFSSTAGGEVKKLSGTALTYNFGIVKLVYGAGKEKVVGTTAEINLDAYGFTIPIGDNLTAGYLTSQATHKRAANLVALGLSSQFKLQGERMLVSYGLSKRTSAYFASGRQKLVGGTSAGNEFSTSVSALGIQHKF